MRCQGNVREMSGNRAGCRRTAPDEAVDTCHYMQVTAMIRDRSGRWATSFDLINLRVG
jgi:hypothetical protein